MQSRTIAQRLLATASRWLLVAVAVVAGPAALAAELRWSDPVPVETIGDELVYGIDLVRAELSDAASGAVGLELPLGDALETFDLAAEAVLEPELARRHPDLVTLAGTSRSDPTLRARVTRTSQGLYARIYTDRGTFVVEPAEPGTTCEGRYLAASEVALQRRRDVPAEAAPLRRPIPEPPATLRATPLGEFSGIATYRLAVGSTAGVAEALRQAGREASSGSILEMIAVAVHEANEIFARDLGVRFEIVPASEELIYLDPGTEPFTATDENELLDEMKPIFQCEAGPDGFDLGHLINAKGWSVAHAGAGQAAWKAGGTTGVIEIDRGRIDLAYLAHELAHQLGAEHTWSGARGACDEDTFHADSAVEAGSGSTLMGYAGLCSADDLQPYSDLYFHAHTIRQVRRYLASGDVDLPPPVATGRRPPDVAAGAGIVVPRGSSFAVEPERESDDPHVVYTWEQMNPVPRRTERIALCCEAIYQSVIPGPLSAQGTEGFPLCGHDCTMDLVLSARDVRGGATRLEDRRVVVRHEAGPFELYAPQPGDRLTGAVAIRWHEADTRRVLGASEVTVTIRCGNDLLYEETTDNDGETEWTVPPGTYCADASIVVRPPDAAYFARVDDVRVSDLPQAPDGE